MTDRSSEVEGVQTPEDVATLYSWANLHGAKYRDFSASRQQVRAQSRTKLLEEQDALAEAAIRETVAANALHSPREGINPAVVPPIVRQHVIEEPPFRSVPGAFAPAPSAPVPAATVPTQPFYRQTAPSASEQPFARPTAHASSPFERAPSAPASATPPRAQEFNLPGGRPAWLFNDTESAVYGQGAGAETLQQSRERVATRWFALKGLFEQGIEQQEEPKVQPVESRVPALAVFSLAGGVGKTSLVATLGRSLSALGERVLLVDTTSYGLLPFYFGARELRPGVARVFSPPGGSTDSPIHLLNMDPDDRPMESEEKDWLVDEVARQAKGQSRLLIDLQTASGLVTRRFLKMSPTVLVPIAPDMNSVVSLSSVDSFFRANSDSDGKPIRPFYVLNQFDASLPLHLDVREVLRQQLGDRLLPFVLRRSPSVSEALAEGMTVVDYAPNSPVAEDFMNLSSWIRSISAPATIGFRGVRWSER